MKENILTYKNYFGSVEYCAVDNILHGKLLGIADSVGYHADSVKGLQEAFVEAVNDYLEVCKAKGKEPQKPYRGSFNIRIKPELHIRLAMCAKERGQSLNATVEEAVSNFVATA